MKPKSSLHISTPKTGRCFVDPPTAIQPSDKVLFALHGYGQLPQYFLRRFDAVRKAGWRIVAPEGLHRFYVEGTSGRVGASWMTKEERLTDIEDTLRWLGLVRETVLDTIRPEKLVLLGFSQGVAAAMRWAAMGKQPADWDGFIFWAGVLPPDLSWEDGLHGLRGIPIHTALGDQDPFFDEQLAQASKALFHSAKLEVVQHIFEGKHHIEENLLVEILNQL
jgi:predicted esterase